MSFLIKDSLGYLMASVYRIFSSTFKERLNKYRLTPPQFAVLSFLWKHDAISQINLGVMMNKDRTNISGIVDRLEKEGLVVRGEDPHDRRAHRICLTSRGAELRDELEAIASDVNLEVTAMLTEEERNTLRGLLKRVIEGNRSGDG